MLLGVRGENRLINKELDMVAERKCKRVESTARINSTTGRLLYAIHHLLKLTLIMSLIYQD